MGKTIEGLQLTEIHSAGRAVGQFNSKNIFVPFGIPGETVDVTLDRRQRGFYSGTIQRIVVPSANRITPFCKHYGTCGGCNWQHITYPEQLRLKRRILENALQKYQIETPAIPEVIPSPGITFYRNKVEYAFSAETHNIAEEHRKEQNVLGFHPIEQRNKVIEIEECWLQRSPSRKICEAVHAAALRNNISFYHYENKKGLLRNIIIRTSTLGETMVIIGFTEDAPQLREILLNELVIKVPEISSLFYTTLTSIEKGYADGEITKFTGAGYLSERMGDLTFQISPKAFFQPNPEQAYHIYRKVLEYASPKGNEIVYDLYTGAGTIACFVAPYINTVIGIEGSYEAINDAKINASINKLTNTEFICGDVLQTFNYAFVEGRPKPDIIILDPPRSGTLIEIKKTILRSAPEKIIYVSCNPVSLAFDLTMLTDGYKVKNIQPYDMFPHTHHVETVVLLEKL